MSSRVDRPIKKEGLVLVILVMLSLFGGAFYMITPVRARVFSMDLPNVDLGVLDLKIIGEYEIHLDDLNLSGYFKVNNETVRYYLEILSADVNYKATSETGRNITVRYDIEYEGLNFTVASDSFALSVDYVQLSTKGELVITLTGETTFNLAVYETVPRFEVSRAQWPNLVIVKGAFGRPST